MSRGRAGQSTRVVHWSMNPSTVDDVAADCQRLLGDPAAFKIPDGYPDSLAALHRRLCSVDWCEYGSVGHVVDRYRAFRRERGAEPETDAAADLLSTFDELGGDQAWADTIGNQNKTSSHHRAPLKAVAIHREAIMLCSLGIDTTADLRTAVQGGDYWDIRGRVDEDRRPALRDHLALRLDVGGRPWSEARPHDPSIRRQRSRDEGPRRLAVAGRRHGHGRSGPARSLGYGSRPRDLAVPKRVSPNSAPVARRSNDLQAGGTVHKRAASLWATRDFRQDRCLARLGPGVRREALYCGCPPVCWVWLSFGLQSVGHRDEAWLERGLPSS